MAYETIKRELEERLTGLQARLVNIKKDVTRPHSVDFADQAQERENDEVVDAIGNETAHSIRVIQSALERIDKGIYGICGDCGEGISKARLQAIPETTLCVDCAD